MTLTHIEQPTEPGWYRSIDGNDYMIFLRLPDIDVPDVFLRKAAWMAITRDGNATGCTWEYIAQSGPVERFGR